MMSPAGGRQLQGGHTLLPDGRPRVPCSPASAGRPKLLTNLVHFEDWGPLQTASPHSGLQENNFDGDLMSLALSADPQSMAQASSKFWRLPFQFCKVGERRLPSTTSNVGSRRKRPPAQIPGHLSRTSSTAESQVILYQKAGQQKRRLHVGDTSCC